MLLQFGFCSYFLVQQDVDLNSTQYNKGQVYGCTTAWEAVWLRKLLEGLFGQIPRPTVIPCDNRSCVQMLVNNVFHDKSKHIEIRYHFIHDMVQKSAIKIQYVPADDQTVDVLTKPLPNTKFEYFHGRIGL